MADTKRLAFSIIQFLHDQMSSGSLSSDAQESLEGKLFPSIIIIKLFLDTFMLLVCKCRNSSLF